MEESAFLLGRTPAAQNLANSKSQIVISLKPSDASKDTRMSKRVVSVDRIRKAILTIRGCRVILDRDLAVLYGVPTKALKQAVKRNIVRFPDDFMLVLTPKELAEWRSQFVTSKADRMGVRHAPIAFTEHGIAMLSSVLNSERAIQVNIDIMRAFVRLRELIATNRDLARRLDDLEKKYDAQFKVVFDAIRALMVTPEPRRRAIGFRVEEGRPAYRPRRRRAAAHGG